MPRYVDGYVIPIPKRNVAVYRSIARKSGTIWLEHGALEYRECVGENLRVRWTSTFPNRFRCKPGETVIFAWIVYRSRAHRDRVNAKVMKDPRISAMMDTKSMPFDVKRMVFGGFEAIVDLQRPRG
jgi:uncharacterized protein YbaA (DUF1428 family)